MDQEKKELFRGLLGFLVKVDESGIDDDLCSLMDNQVSCESKDCKTCFFDGVNEENRTKIIAALEEAING